MFSSLKIVGAAAAVAMTQVVASAATINVNSSVLAGFPASGSASSTIGAFTLGYVPQSNEATGAFTAFSSSDYTTAFVDPSNEGVRGFRIGNNASVPAIVGNTTGNTKTLSYGSTLQANQLLLHPGGLSGDAFAAPIYAADLRYSVTSTGLYSINAQFDNLGIGATDKHVFVNGIAYTTGPVLLTAGSHIDFVVGDGGDTIGSDSTGLFAQITQTAAVPLPPAALGGLGLFGSIFFGKRLRRQNV